MKQRRLADNAKREASDVGDAEQSRALTARIRFSWLTAAAASYTTSPHQTTLSVTVLRSNQLSYRVFCVCICLRRLMKGLAWLYASFHRMHRQTVTGNPLSTANQRSRLGIFADFCTMLYLKCKHANEKEAPFCAALGRKHCPCVALPFVV